MPVPKDLPDLINAGVISQETADRIAGYYRQKSSGTGASRLYVVFGILGALLVGLGIILIIAHNWDDLSRGTKAFLAFLPLVAGQALCGFTLLRRAQSVAWRESCATFLFLAVGASISLISQIYNIPGNVTSFLLTWSLLGLPLVYLMSSSLASLLYLVGITWYACDGGYWSYPGVDVSLYWALLAANLPFYYLLYRRKPASNFMTFHNWMIPLSVIIVFGTIADHTEELMFIAYMSLFGLLYLVGNLRFFDQQKLRNNSYKVLGSLGTIGLLLPLSFDALWEDIRNESFPLDQVITSPEFVAAFIVTILASYVLYFHVRGKIPIRERPVALVFILFIAIFLLGLKSAFATVLVNALVLGIGLLTVREGGKRDHLGILNYGLLIITALIVCRFFDTDLSYVLRGTLFVAAGAGFFVANTRLLKRRKARHE